MILYALIDNSGTVSPRFFGTRAEGHEVFRNIEDRLERQDTYLAQIDLPTAKDDLLGYLNAPDLGVYTGKAWRLTPRGGLVEWTQ